jgi:hypothetical protein
MYYRYCELGSLKNVDALASTEVIHGTLARWNGAMA